MNNRLWPLAIALAAVPFVIVLQNRTLAPITLLAFGGVILAGWRAGWRPSPPPLLVWPAVALLGWAMVTILWAPEAGRVADSVLRLGATLALAVLAADALRGVPLTPLIPRAAAIGLSIGIAAALFDDLSGHMLRAAVRGIREAPLTLSFGLKNAASVVALLLPLAVFAPVLPRWSRIALGVSGAVVALLLPGESAKLAVLAGLAVGMAATVAPRATRVSLAGTVAVLVLALPWVLGAALPRDVSALPFSAAHRLLIWDFTAERIADRPVLGWGMDSSRAIPGGTERTSQETRTAFGLTAHDAHHWFIHQQMLPLHPHNMPLQIWLELGAVGAALMALLLALVALACRNPAACGAFAAALVISLLSYGMWQYWWVAGLMLAAVSAPLVGGRKPA
ncbi:O-antigen ligase family protein [Roseococcus sp. SDR]|uniref:O-antigen ligase family protein n=1 Tax=Roseococcus sp. SDR TaxID=2835532 RepID=UPI001BCFBF8A|nr:O-antigen ligase family protein [Roseococcus sp. SDR]MBS7789639.1 O-antigen ligase family protein [Roseococcus sp. SDR]MBV1844953.1 O-antigen ligase family protein [Roseococcus sp. SDR]